MIFAVIDTNVLVSAMFNFDSVPGKVISYLFSDKIKPLLNAEIISEYRDVLSRKKFKFDQNLVNQVIFQIEAKALFIDAEHFEEDYPDPKDIVFYEVTMTARKDKESYLVTGNSKHFPSKSFVITPREMIDLIENN